MPDLKLFEVAEISVGLEPFSCPARFSQVLVLGSILFFDEPSDASSRSSAAMSDNKSLHGPTDRSCISTNEPYGANYAAGQLAREFPRANETGRPR